LVLLMEQSANLAKDLQILKIGGQSNKQLTIGLLDHEYN
jgi:hypothetical protein